jgi:hypothetical protein
VPSLSKAGYKAPNEKLNVAGIGAGNQALGDLRSVAQSENIVALADVDDRRAGQGFTTWPKATQYRDFRKMLDKEGDTIDAVVIAIPDHNHAYTALWCMERGKHVYCEKPLTRTPWEARQMTKAVVHRMGCARRHLRALRRQAAVGRGQAGVHQQPGSQQVHQAGFPQGLGNQGSLTGFRERKSGRG